MLIPGNRTLLFLLLIICPLFWRREDTLSPFSSSANLIIHTTSLSKLDKTQRSGLLRSFKKFCFLKLTMISYPKPKNTQCLFLTFAKNIIALTQCMTSTVLAPLQPKRGTLFTLLKPLLLIRDLRLNYA